MSITMNQFLSQNRAVESANGAPFQTKKFQNLKFCECSNY